MFCRLQKKLGFPQPDFSGGDQWKVGFFSKEAKEIFEKMGVTEIASVGETFNPDFHNAVMHIDDENVGENIVTEEFQKGYMYKDKVIRYAMVKVAN